MLLLIAGSVSAACLAGFRPLPSSTSRIDLIPAAHPVRLAFIETVRQFGPQNLIVIVVEGAGAEARRLFADRVAAGLAEGGTFQGRVFHRLDLAPMLARGPLYLEPAELEQMRKYANDGAAFLAKLPDLARALRVLEDRVDQAAQRGLAGISDVLRDVPRLSGTLRVVTRALEGEPLSSESWREALGEPEVPALKLFDETGHLASGDGSLHFVFVLPDRQSEEAAYLAPLVASLRDAIRAAAPAAPGVSASLTGIPLGILEEQASADRDLYWTAVAAFLGNFVILLAGLHFLSAASTMLALGLAILWTLAFAQSILTSLNLVSSVFTLFLVGMGINYGIYIATRFEHERGAGLEAPEAMRRTLEFQGPGVLTSAAASCAVFLTLCACPFRGFQELGLLAAVGLLLCLLANLLVLPSLLVLTDRWRRLAGPRREASFGWLVSSLEGRPQGALFCVTVVTLLAVIQGELFPFDYDLQRVLPAGAESVEAGRKLHASGSLSPMAAVLVCEELDEVSRKTRWLQQMPAVANTLSWESFVPGQLARKRALLDEIARELAPGEEAAAGRAPALPAAVRAACSQLEETLERNRATLLRLQRHPEADALRRSLVELARLRAALDRLPPATASEALARASETLRRSAGELVAQVRRWRDASAPDESFVPEALRRSLRSPEGRFAILVSPREDIGQRGPFERFHRALSSVDPAAGGYPVIIHTMLNLLPDILRQSLGRAMLVLVLLLAFGLRSVSRVLLALSPVLFGGIWLMGLMKLLGLDYNQVNFLALPMILGVGIENGVNFVNALEGKRWDRAVETQAMGMSLSAGTSVLGFAALAFVSHRGLASFGVLLSLGTVTCLVAALTALPLLVVAFAPPSGWRDSLRELATHRFY